MRWIFYSVVLLMFFSCEKEVPYEPTRNPCDGTETNRLIGEWEMHSMNARGLSHLDCTDTICPYMNLVLYESGEYALDYFMYHPHLEQPDYFSGQDTGTFVYECDYNNGAGQRVIYIRTNGELQFTPIGKLPYAWKTTEDGFWGLQIDMELTDEEDFNARLTFAK